MVYRKGVLHFHENTRTPVARVTTEKIMALNIENLLHPPYSPLHAPSECHLFNAMEFFRGKSNYKM